MEDCKVRYCRVCFTVIEDENYEVIDSNSKNNLIIDLLKLDFDDDGNREICNVCSTGLSATQKIKMTCLYTENVINQYVIDTTLLHLDLRKIYMRETTREQVSEDIKICRLCMQPINDISEFNSINEEQVNMIQKLVPEMNIFKIQEPVMCTDCRDSLRVHCNFLEKCWNMEQNIGNGPNRQISNIPSPKPPVNISVKIEDVDPEFKDVPELKTECLDINYEEIKTESEITSEGPAAYKNLKIPCYTSPNQHKVRMCQWEQHTHETKYQTGLEDNTTIGEDSSVHNNPSEYTNRNHGTKNNTAHKTHLLLHQDPSEVRRYKCENCNFETIHRWSLKTHRLIHQDISQVRMYKCEDCDYQTKHKNNYLNHHMLIHKDSSETKRFKCESCNFRTKQKRCLKNHVILHNDHADVRIYKCENCSYETKFRDYLRKHMRVHRDPSEVQMYKCQYCNFATKNKSYLKRHCKSKHKNSAELQTYKCEHCNYKTLDGSYLKRHVLIHTDLSEVKKLNL